MGTPYLDPNLPVDNSPLDAGEMRGQFQAIADQFAHTESITSAWTGPEHIKPPAV